jgi:hypothetical protein
MLHTTSKILFVLKMYIIFPAQAPTVANNKRKLKTGSQPSLNDWLKKWKTKQNKTNSSDTDTLNCTPNDKDCSKIEDSVLEEILLPDYKIPAVLQGVVPLPLSLVPPPPHVLSGLVLEDWG